eukprot:1146110-Pelagomonas_calceolata.AAC.3
MFSNSCPLPFLSAGGSVINLTYVASNRVIPGYGGGMSSAKAVSTRAPCCLPSCVHMDVGATGVA